MTAATERVQTQPYSAHPIPTMFSAEMANAAIWKKGWLIASNASGLLVKYTATTGLTSAGIADKDDDNTANDNRFANVHCGVFSFLMHSGDELLVSDRFAVAYGQDNQTVRKTGTSISPCGVFLGLDPNDTSRAMVWVGPAAAALANALLSDDTLAASLAAITNGNGASLIGIEDAAGLLAAANVEAAILEILKTRAARTVRGVVTANVADLTAFTVASNDGLTYVAGDRVLLPVQTTAAQCGIYVVGTVAGATAPLTRATDMPAGLALPNGSVIEASEGTTFAGSTWKSMATTTGGAVIGTNDPLFYPQNFRKTVALVSGTIIIGAGGGSEPLFLFSTTKSSVTATRNTAAGTLTNTTHYFCPVSGRVAGKAGTGAVSVTASVAAGTVNTADTSTVDVLVVNW